MANPLDEPPDQAPPPSYAELFGEADDDDDAPPPFEQHAEQPVTEKGRPVPAAGDTLDTDWKPVTHPHRVYRLDDTSHSDAKVRRACEAWALRGCAMTSGPRLCCACLDRRPLRPGPYAAYVDGHGCRDQAPWWQGYCPACQRVEAALDQEAVKGRQKEQKERKSEKQKQEQDDRDAEESFWATEQAVLDHIKRQDERALASQAAAAVSRSERSSERSSWLDRMMASIKSSRSR